ncbi:DUF3102 domain-containing protein [Tolypothrix campylonemoides VB511288]|nr:DUF3102 domain-containing protein [Tolypothrix campylonemoides VB511288]
MNEGNLRSELLEHLSEQQTLNFEYPILDAETRMIVQKRTNEIKTLMRRTSQDIIEIGQKLIEVKQHLKHGSFTNWLKSEFNWSISTATKFMQVAEQFKFVNFTNLNITASALYLIAAPSTPKQARAEVLERATLGENISYTKVKAIIFQHKNIAKSKLDQRVTVDVFAKTPKSKFIKPTRFKDSAALYATEQLIGNKAQMEIGSLSSINSLAEANLEDNQTTTTIKDISCNNAQTPTNIINPTTISHDMSDAIITEIATSIKDLTPEQLTLVIIKSANSGLSTCHLEAIIKASQHVLNTQQ